MTLEELKERLKSEYVDGQADMIITFVEYADDEQIRELSNIIMSAKIKQPGTPKKYFTEYERWSYKIENAIIFSTEKYAQGAISNLKYRQKELQYETYKHGFIITKPATP